MQYAVSKQCRLVGRHVDRQSNTVEFWSSRALRPRRRIRFSSKDAEDRMPIYVSLFYHAASRPGDPRCHQAASHRAQGRMEGQHGMRGPRRRGSMRCEQGEVGISGPFPHSYARGSLPGGRRMRLLWLPGELTVITRTGDGKAVSSQLLSRLWPESFPKDSRC